MPALIHDDPPPQTPEYIPARGRLAAADPRDAKHEIPRAVVREAKEVRRRYHQPGPMLNQGQTPQCVAFSTCRMLRGSPVRQVPHLSEAEIYAWCQRHDEWPGEAYAGTSTRASMRWLKENGYISEYQWARDAEGLFAHILTRGPALIGVNWYPGMDDVDEAGYLRVTGVCQAGHQVMIGGADRDRIDPVTGKPGAFRGYNTWGANWGDVGGAFWLTAADMERLLAEDGDGALPVELKRVA